MLKPYCISGVIEAGCDEAGRGPLAGSVFAAAVILDPNQLTEPEWEMLNDSKQMTEAQRNQLRPFIEQHAVSWAVAEVTAQEIDKINILNASLLGMHRVLAQLDPQPQHILVDGNRWRPYMPSDLPLEVPARTVVHGDATYLSIAAASVLAKTWRDEYMLRLHEQYPQYGWDSNKGYPTAAHYAALKEYGPTPYHRLTFNLKCEVSAKK